MAVDGGTTRSLLDVQLPRLEASGSVPRIVTITVGGNDVLAAYGDTRRALEMVQAVRTGVAEALARLRVLMAPEDPLIVGTVYDPSDGTGETQRVGLPPWPDVADVIAELNAALRSTAAECGALIADIHALFLGHGLSQGDVSQQSARPRNHELWYCKLIEPNAWGASAVRAAFWESLQKA